MPGDYPAGSAAQGQAALMIDAGTAQILVSLGELKTAVSVLDERVRNIQTDRDDHEQRIRSLESTSARSDAVDLARRRALAAVWAAVGSGAAAIGTALTLFAQRH